MTKTDQSLALVHLKFPSLEYLYTAWLNTCHCVNRRLEFALIVHHDNVYVFRARINLRELKSDKSEMTVTS